MVLHEQKVYADQKSGPRKMLITSSVAIRGENNGEDEVRAGKVLLLLGCWVKGESRGEGAAFFWYLKTLPSFGQSEYSSKTRVSAVSECGLCGKRTRCRKERKNVKVLLREVSGCRATHCMLL